MRNFLNLLVISLLVLPLMACNSKKEEKKSSCCSGETTEKVASQSCCSHGVEAKEVMVYYFHFTRRCATCQAVEEVTQQALKENFAGPLEDGQVSFVSVNLDKEKELAEKFEVSGQTLLVVKGAKKTNLTNQAFMNARTNPDKVKALLKDTITPLI